MIGAKKTTDEHDSRPFLLLSGKTRRRTVLARCSVRMGNLLKRGFSRWIDLNAQHNRVTYLLPTRGAGDFAGVCPGKGCAW